MHISKKAAPLLQLMAFAIALAGAFLWGCTHLRKNPYLIGRDPTWYPENLANKTEQINGFTNALIAKIGNKKLVIVESDSVNLLAKLDDQTFDAILSSYPPTVTAKGRYLFSNPYLLIGPVLVVPKSSTTTSIAELSEKIIGLSPDDESIQIAQKNPSLVIRNYASMPVALKDLAAGKLDAVLINTLEANALVPKFYANTLRIATYPLNDKGLRLITSLGQNEELITVFNEKLAALRESDEYTTLRMQFQVD